MKGTERSKVPKFKFAKGDRVRDITPYDYGEGVVVGHLFGYTRVLLDDGDYAAYREDELEFVEAAKEDADP